MAVNVPRRLRAAAATAPDNLPQRPPILAAVQPNDRISVTVNNQTSPIRWRPGADARSRVRLLGQLRFAA